MKNKRIKLGSQKDARGGRESERGNKEKNVVMQTMCSLKA
jgi:hypothetical protein